MKVSSKIDFRDEESLRSILQTAQTITRKRFSLEISREECIRGLKMAREAEVGRRGMTTVDSAAQRQHIEAAADWLINAEGKPGLFLYGNPGNGKTTMLRSLKRLTDLCIKHTLPIEEWRLFGLIDAREYALMALDENRKEEMERIKKQPLLAIDDLGQDPEEIVRFGALLNPMVDLLQYRYDHQMVTIVATNMMPSAISKRYGARVADRLREMMQMILFTNPTYRR